MTEKKRSKFIRFLGYAIPLLLVVYTVSAGPASAIAFNSVLMISDPPELKDVDPFFIENLYRSFYKPLFWILEKNQFIDALFSDYQYFCFEMMYPDYFS